MKKKVLYSKLNQDLVVCLETDIPPLSTQELMLLFTIKEQMEQKNTNILRISDIFEHYIYKKWERFELLSRLVKRKALVMNRFDSNSHEFKIIPNDNYKDSKEFRIYKPKSKDERLSIIKEFTMIK
jgi:DTW domain-containing protein YfiP